VCVLFIILSLTDSDINIIQCSSYFRSKRAARRTIQKQAKLFGNDYTDFDLVRLLHVMVAKGTHSPIKSSARQNHCKCLIQGPAPKIRRLVLNHHHIPSEQDTTSRWRMSVCTIFIKRTEIPTMDATYCEWCQWLFAWMQRSLKGYFLSQKK